MTEKVTEKHKINGQDPDFPIRLAVMYRKSGGKIGDLFQQKGTMFARTLIFQTFVFRWDSMIEITKGMFLKVYKGLQEQEASREDSTSLKLLSL